MLTISSGHSADYLLDAVATGRENYYTGAVAAGEPPGRWYGKGAEELGLTGLVDPQDMRAVFEHYLDPRDPNFRDPEKWDEVATLGHTGRKYQTADEIYQRSLDAEPYADAERREQLRLDASKRARKNVAFLDVTFSVQKSVTILHAAFEAQEVKARNAGDEEAAKAWGDYRQAVEDAIWAGNQAGLDYLQENAGYSRVGHHGGAAGRFIDAHGWTIASFFQHDSRNHDPQLHIHNPTSNRVLCSDGVWRTLDSRGIHKIRPAAGAVAERTTAERLTSSMRVLLAMRPDGKAREILGIPKFVNDLYSSRRRAITPKTAELVSAFETKHGRAPNSLELDRLHRQATFATRRAKSHEGETTEQRLDRVDRELRAEIDGGLAELAADVLAIADKEAQPDEWSPAEVIATALAEVQSRKAAWTRADLTRAINDVLPDYLGLDDGELVAELLDQLTTDALELAVALDADRPAERVLPDELRLANGRSAYEAPGARLYATPEHIHTERLLAHAVSDHDAPALDDAAARRVVDDLRAAGVELGVDQAAAVRGVLTSGAAVESLVGPAGTGKSFVVGVLAQAWQNPALWDGQQRRLVGLASSQIATEVLAGEGLAGRNIARWLATQQRLDEGKAFGDDRDWRLAPGDLVVVDESAMADTTDLAAIHRHVTAAKAKLLLTGDHRQLAAVGTAGGMQLAAETTPSYELSEARRFTHGWERAASLRLREGDESVLGEYHKHGRLLDSGAIEQAQASAARAWLADIVAGKRSLLIVDTNEQAARLSAQIRADLIRLGRVAENGVPLGLQDTVAGVGDIVQARRNQWDLAGVLGNRRGPINREQYRVLDTLEDGGLIVTPMSGATGERITLPGRYVSEHVALGYASTVHSAQGLTVDTSHAVITGRTGAAALYVGLSRGRDSNTAHVCTRAVSDDAPTGTVNRVAHRDPVTVIAAAFDLAQPEQSALATAADSRAEAESIRTPSELFIDGCEQATAGRTARWLDELGDAGHLSPQQRVQLAAEDGATTLNRVLRQAELSGHNPRQVLHDVVTSRDLAGARQLTNVLHHRITGSVSLDPGGDSHADWVPAVDDPAWRNYLTELADIADARRDELGREVAEQQPQWAVEALGPPPDDDEQRAQWARRAGAVAAHRELTGHDDPATAIGPAPKAGQAEANASWRAAWHALGRPEADRAEAEMSDGQLLMRIRSDQREQTWAPPYVANELAGTRQAAERHRATATLRATAAAAIDDRDQRAQLEREAADADALTRLLDERAAQLAKADDARARWYAHTAATRATADRAQLELAERRAARGDDGHGEQRVTAGEHLDAGHHLTRREHADRVQRDASQRADRSTAHQAARDAAAEQHDSASRERAPQPATTDGHIGSVDHARSDEPSGSRRVQPAPPDTPEDDREHEITDEADLADVVAQREAARHAVDDRPHPDAAETGVADIRDDAAYERRRHREDEVRVPTADEIADALRRAHRALAEIRARDADDARRATEDARTDQLAQWHYRDRDAAERAALDDHTHYERGA
jgi:conjugative relaxase-like TrwC/TraI family protein